MDKNNLLSEQKSTNIEKNKSPSPVFSELLNSSEITTKNSEDLRIPKWVNKDYHYDPENPRKPNFRELVEALSGQNLEQLSSGPKTEWKHYSELAHEILYGVIGSSDTRNWEKIMSSSNIVQEAHKETGLMHKPKVDIISEIDKDKNVLTQRAVIVDKSGDILKTLDGNHESITVTLQSYGATSESIPVDIENQINISHFDKEVLDAIRSFSKKQADSSTIELITNRISKKIEQSMNEILL